MGIKRIILHAGMPKTGSTSIQLSLFYNERLLRKNGYLYIADWGAHQGPVLYSLFSSKQNYYGHVISGHTTPEEIQEANRQWIDQLDKAVSRTQCEILVISGEDVCALRADEMAQMRSFFIERFGEVDIQVMLYMRNPVDVDVSMVQQIILHQAEPNSFDTTPKKGENFYENRLIKFRQVFGEVAIFKFEDAVSHKGGLVGHFLEAIGIAEPEVERFRVFRANEGSCMEVLELAMYAWRECPLIIEADKKWINNPLRTFGDVGPLLAVRGPKFDVPYEERVQIQAARMDNMIWLKESAGIDYTACEIKKAPAPVTYNEDTIQDFIQAYPNLSHTWKKIFLDFFEKKHKETGDDKFRQLYARGSAPYHIYQYSCAFSRILQTQPEGLLGANVLYDGINSAMPPDKAQIFIDYGDGYPETDSVFFVKDHNNSLQISLRFEESDHITKFRIDPSMFPSVVLLQRLQVNGRENNYQILGGNYFSHYGDVFSFFVDDPQIYFSCEEAITSIDLELTIDTGSYPFVYTSKRLNNRLYEVHQYLEANDTEKNNVIVHNNVLLDQKDTMIAVINKQLTEKNDIIDSLDRKYKELEQGFNELSAAHNAIIGSKSWQLTKPFRDIADLFRK